jgi:hypothetical protein
MILGRFNKHNKGKYVATWISLGSENKSERCVLLRKIMRAKPIESPVWDIIDNALIIGPTKGRLFATHILTISPLKSTP